MTRAPTAPKRWRAYEYYGKMAEKISTYGTEKVKDFFMSLQVWGTPEQCYAKILDARERVGNEHFVGVFSYAGMPWDEAERNIRLFAREVTPELQKLAQGVHPAVKAVSHPGEELGIGVLGT